MIEPATAVSYGAVVGVKYFLLRRAVALNWSAYYRIVNYTTDHYTWDGSVSGLRVGVSGYIGD
jgi:hypothetical protein